MCIHPFGTPCLQNVSSHNGQTSRAYPIGLLKRSLMNVTHNFFFFFWSILLNEVQLFCECTNKFSLTPLPELSPTKTFSTTLSFWDDCLFAQVNTAMHSSIECLMFWCIYILFLIASEALYAQWTANLLSGLPVWYTLQFIQPNNVSSLGSSMVT